MDIKNVFYPNLFSAQAQVDAIKHELWPLILGVHLGLDERVQLGTLTNKLAILMDSYGFPVLAISAGSDKYHLRKYDNPSGSQSTLLASTANSRYLLARLRKTAGGRRKEPMRTAINRALDFSVKVIPMVVEAGIMAFARGVKSFVREETFCLDTQAQQWALLTAYGDKQLIEVPGNVKSDLDRAYEFYSQRNDKIEAFKVQALDLLDREKWVLGYLKDTGIVAGKVKLGDTVPLLVGYARNGFIEDVKWLHLDVLVPFALHRSVDTMPVEHQREVKAALTLAKINRDNQAGAHSTYADPEALILDTLFLPVVQHRIGAISWNRDHINWTMVDA